MNDILQLKGEFHHKKHTPPTGPKLPKKGSVKVVHLKKLKDELVGIQKFWKTQPLFSNPLVSVYYCKVIAKSNRISGLLVSGSENANDSVVGAKFTNNQDNPKHIITHCVTNADIEESIKRLNATMRIINNFFQGEIKYDDLKNLIVKVPKQAFCDIKKTIFAKVVVNAYYVEKFDIEMSGAENLEDDAIVSLYDVGKDPEKLLKNLGIQVNRMQFIDKTTVLLIPSEYKLLKKTAPFLISMAVSDLSNFLPEKGSEIDNSLISIPDPRDEPIIGVIDSQFDQDVYFSKWVNYYDYVSKDIPRDQHSADHGTEIDSIIVDGPSFNPSLQDNCGRFRVRHFGVTNGGRASSFAIIKSIEKIVLSNKDIKVWNLSLGSPLEVNPNFISPEAAVLDKLQYENDIIFVVSGTNRTNANPEVARIGAPADSINSIVVNAVNKNRKPASYSRRGPVLSFFAKPDVCYFGGDFNDDGMVVCSPLGKARVDGTSFATPWITRKVAFLIYKMGLSREVAKALLIDATAGWSKNNLDQSLVGFGIVPTKIDNIVQSDNNEIRFILSGISNEYDTYNYNIPVPLDNNKSPFIGRATICYFPKCSRNQGVDYTNTELDIHLGRISTGGIKSINNNKQSDQGFHDLSEEVARKNFRKWDNIKHIGEVYKSTLKERKIYQNNLWGVSIKSKNRLNSVDGNGVKFGLVVTLKEINGVNRIESFINQCSLRGWIVNQIDVENQIQIYQQGEENINLD